MRHEAYGVTESGQNLKQEDQFPTPLDFDRAVEYALEDFKKNHEHYYRTWCKT